ncbi:hypothetical protein D9613_010183 [Agrocybe pediades]|uniref:F-box domain-containing protein n=1 Tax=Agrocybe pediades TaxID=84607 RepID=A0A8H4QX15_9AGAR|nr:hypothetical protein D9613_010183 [Agrocybe pediades]
MTFGVLDKLPQELRDACFDTLCDFLPESDRRQALRTCLLVCRDWNHQARTLLFRNIRIEDPDCIKRTGQSLTSISRLRDLLKDEHVPHPFPRLCAYIRAIRVKVVLSQPLWEQVDGDFANILASLAQAESGVSELELEIPGREWQQLSEGFRKSLGELCHSRHLRKLKLAGISHIPVSFFYGISLDDLWVNFRESPDEQDDISSTVDPKGFSILALDFSSHTALYPYNWTQLKQPGSMVEIKHIATSLYLSDLDAVSNLLSRASPTLESLEITRICSTHCRDWNSMDANVRKFDMRNMSSLDVLRFDLNLSCFEPTETGKFGGMISFLEACHVPENCSTLYIDVTLHNCWWHKQQNRLLMGDDEKWYILAEVLSLPRFSAIRKFKINFHIVFQFLSAMFRGNPDATKDQIQQLMQLWFSDVEGEGRFEFHVAVSALDKTR